MVDLHALLENIPALELCEDEADYKKRFSESIKSINSSFELALKGGLIADRMAWVFMAGYQAAIRACFSLSNFNHHQSDHWLCIAVSEPKEEEGKPGVTYVDLEDHFQLTGFKSWIAACDSVDALVVKAGRGKKAICLYLPADVEHLAISKKINPKVLVELSQGEAFLDNVIVSKDQLLDPLLLKVFPKFEAYYIYVAIGASIYAHTHEKDVDTASKALEFLENLEVAELDSESDIARLEGIPENANQEFAGLYQMYKSSPGLSKYASPADEKILSVYSNMLDGSSS